MNFPGSCPTAWAERYESLRHYVLEGRQRLQTQPLGLALWLAKGMAGWMRQWSQWLDSAAAPPSPVARPGAPAEGPCQEQLTWLLAQITLPHLPPRPSL